MISSEMVGIVGPALAACLMIVLTHAPLGIEVLKRGIIFIDLAVAQIAGLGLVVPVVLFDEASLLLTQVIALTCAMLAGFFFSKIETLIPDQQEAVIGVSFVLAASLAILFLADHQNSGQEIQHLLSGQMLFVTWASVALHAPIYLLIFVIWFTRPKVRTGIGFYMVFAFAITSSVQMVGVYVVFASLILPAFAALNTKHPYTTAWATGILSVLCGIMAAIVLDAPSGPVTVVSYTVAAVVVAVIKNIKKETKIR